MLKFLTITQDFASKALVSLAASIIFWTMMPAPSIAQPMSPQTQEFQCDNNNAEACTLLGIRLTDGDNVPKDERRGANLFLKACNMENARACMLWGYALDTGRGAYVNLPQASAYYKMSCELGNAIGCNNHGTMFRDGRGEVKSEIFALRFFAQSCRLQFAAGCLNEGLIHADATTLRQNRTLAVAAFERGCILNDLDSCNKQAWHIEQGVGTSRDPAKAAQLYRFACNRGYQLACTNGQLLTGVSAAASARNSSGAGSDKLPPPANGTIGHVVCSVINTQEKKMWVTWGFTAPESRHQELANAYLQKLLSDGLIPRSGNFSNLALDCRGHRSLADAVRFKNDLMRGAARGRYVFTPTIFNPI